MNTYILIPHLDKSYLFLPEEVSRESWAAAASLPLSEASHLRGESTQTMVGHKHLMLQGCWITSVSSTWMSSSQSCVETSTDSSNSWEPNQKFHTGEVRQLWLEKKIHESSDISENSGGLWLFDLVKVCDCQVSIDVKADLEDLGRDPEEPWWNLEWQISHTNMIQYDCLGTKWWTKHPKKGRLHRKWYNRQLIKQYQTFWYHSKAQECVGFNALFDPTYENPWNLGWVESKTLEFIAGQITRWMTPFANLRGPKTLQYALLILTKFIALATLMDKLHVWIQHVFWRRYIRCTVTTCGGWLLQSSYT